LSLDLGSLSMGFRGVLESTHQGRLTVLHKEDHHGVSGQAFLAHEERNALTVNLGRVLRNAG
jgi:hypothetical protein